MMHLFKHLAAPICLALAGCSAVQPSSIVPYPTSARAQPAALTSSSPGAIFQAQAYRPLFEDRRARAVGDAHLDLDRGARRLDLVAHRDAVRPGVAVRDEARAVGRAGPGGCAVT